MTRILELKWERMVGKLNKISVELEFWEADRGLRLKYEVFNYGNC